MLYENTPKRDDGGRRREEKGRRDREKEAEDNVQHQIKVIFSVDLI